MRIKSQWQMNRASHVHTHWFPVGIRRQRAPTWAALWEAGVVQSMVERARAFSRRDLGRP